MTRSLSHARQPWSCVNLTAFIMPTSGKNRKYLSIHSRSQRPHSLWSAPRITTSGQVQQRKSAIHGLPVTLHLLRVKSDKSDWFWSQSIVFTTPFKTRMSLDLARGRNSWCWPKGAHPLGTRIQKKSLKTSLKTGFAQISFAAQKVGVPQKFFFGGGGGLPFIL